MCVRAVTAKVVVVTVDVNDTDVCVPLHLTFDPQLLSVFHNKRRVDCRCHVLLIGLSHSVFSFLSAVC